MSNETDAAILRELAKGANAVADARYQGVLERIASRLESGAKQDAQYEALQEIGKSAFESIADMVAALECDYNRLGELREEHKTWRAENPPRFIDPSDPRDNWALAYPDEADELAELSEAAGDCESREDAERYIQENPLSVEVRSGWRAPGGDNTPEEFCILLGTGGPATRIIGELDQHGEPCRARLQAQDWGTQWTDYQGGDEETLLTYARCFYFGEG